MSQTRHINTSLLSDDEVKAIAHAVAPLIKECFNEEVFTTEQACKFLTFQRSTFDEYVRQGKFRAHRPGGHPRFIKSELIEDLKKM